MAILRESGGERVQLAVIKLSGGQRERLPDLVRMAKADWRDVLAYAEYPEEIKTGPLEMKKMSPEEKSSGRETSDNIGNG